MKCPPKISYDISEKINLHDRIRLVQTGTISVEVIDGNATTLIPWFPANESVRYHLFNICAGYKILNTKFGPILWGKVTRLELIKFGGNMDVDT